MPIENVTHIIDMALDANAEPLIFDGQDKDDILNHLKMIMGESLYKRIVYKYKLNHTIHQNSPLHLNDVRALLIGVVTNSNDDELENDTLKQFIAEHRLSIQNMAKANRASIIKRSDHTILMRKNPFVRLTLEVGKMVSNATLKEVDLKDAFSGVQINKALEEDIKTVLTIDYANKTYANVETLNNLNAVIDSHEKKMEYASKLYLSSDLSYRNLNDNAILPILDEDGKEHLYIVHNIFNDSKFTCTALIPYVNGEDKQSAPLDIKILFRGTHSLETIAADLETTGAGSKTMRDNRIKLLDEVNAIVSTLQDKTDLPVSLSVHGHSLGGSYAERFTSELHQAIYFQNVKEKRSNPEIRDALRDENVKLEWGEHPSETAIRRIQARIDLNTHEMEGKNYSALSRLATIKSTPASSARLSKKEAQVGEGFIALTQNLKNTPSQTFSYFKSKGDPVSQAGIESLGAHFQAGSKVKVEHLKKNAGYGQTIAWSPGLAHCDHPFMRYHDQNVAPLSFSYSNNNTEQGYENVNRDLTSGKQLLRIIQKFYAKIPTELAEPLTTLEKHRAYLIGENPNRIKGKKVKTVKERKQSPKAQLKAIGQELKQLKDDLKYAKEIDPEQWIQFDEKATDLDSRLKNIENQNIPSLNHKVRDYRNWLDNFFSLENKRTKTKFS